MGKSYASSSLDSMMPSFLGCFPFLPLIRGKLKSGLALWPSTRHIFASSSPLAPVVVALKQGYCLLEDPDREQASLAAESVSFTITFRRSSDRLNPSGGCCDTFTIWLLGQRTGCDT
jgi:hypothetical protein